ncbi:sulfate transport system substrate-binding protein [Solimonas aquatica]|uniref:Sulfate transport system substrate-binding protein n=1 Tax=Solimonas aquatica TaxID=489703 RepID=A0A1H9LKQ1_9GAMM|nr:sulfate ABC transporter substrate-binding protein [Solimonas aquatica]SER11948.1 sulfate transport system substrate-binding protein [Solimonas aquatica]
MKRIPRLLVGLCLASLSAVAAAAPLLNVSYDVARNLYRDLNPAFAADWQAKTGQSISIEQSHGGSSKQARSVIDGLQADVVTMNNPLDIDAIAKAGLISGNWAQRLPNRASPSWSPILFIVRKNNPKHIRDWDDLVKPGVAAIIPNPKTSGNGRYSYLGAWEYALRKNNGDEAQARSFVTALFRNVPVLDTGGRGATTTFVQRGIGDVLLTFENEIRLIQNEFGKDGFEVIVPSLTVRADNPVAVVERYAQKKGNEKLARAYLDYHYSSAGQDLIARNDLRPIDEAVLKKYAERFPAVNTFSVEQRYGSWSAAQAKHFADGGLFDQIYAQR